MIEDLENFDPKHSVLTEIRKDADCVHSDGSYFFDINIQRTLILIELDDDGKATIIWTGTHHEYVSVFKYNKSTIEKWLKNKNHIEE